MAVLEHLRSARNSLSEAQAEANVGTALMISPIRERVQNLIERTERLEDNDNED